MDTATFDVPLNPPSTVRDFLTLTKPGVMLLVVFTGLAGMVSAPGFADTHPFFWIITLLCISLGSGGGAAINMWYDRDIDAVMRRTANRPVPLGRVAPADALLLGLVLSLFSVVLLGLGTNWTAGGMLAFAIFFYAVIYTMGLKRRTPQNIVIGGAAGAFPPVIGWLAMGGGLAEPLPWLMFAVTFFWTPPHFWALGLAKGGDYQSAGIPMLPAISRIRTLRQMWVYSLLLLPVALLPAFYLPHGLAYGVAATLLSAWLLVHMSRVWRKASPRRCMRMFGYSIVYLFALFGAMMAAEIYDLVSAPWAGM